MTLNIVVDISKALVLINILRTILFAESYFICGRFQATSIYPHIMI